MLAAMHGMQARQGTGGLDFCVNGWDCADAGDPWSKSAGGCWVAQVSGIVDKFLTCRRWLHQVEHQKLEWLQDPSTGNAKFRSSKHRAFASKAGFC